MGQKVVIKKGTASVITLVFSGSKNMEMRVDRRRKQAKEKAA